MEELNLPPEDQVSVSSPMPRCPKCGWQDVRLSTTKGALDVALSLLSMAAFRCRSCNHRFYRFFKRPVGER
jgi:transposase-like protein